MSEAAHRYGLPWPTNKKRATYIMALSPSALIVLTGQCRCVFASAVLLAFVHSQRLMRIALKHGARQPDQPWTDLVDQLTFTEMICWRAAR